MKRSKSYTWLSGLLKVKPEEIDPGVGDRRDDEWGVVAWARADNMQHESIGCDGEMVYFIFGVALAAIFATIPESVLGDAAVMSHVTAHFGKALEECRKESGLSEEIMEEFHHFWREDFEVVHRELGCAIICMSNKFSLLKDDTRIHHDNMDEYIKSFPNGQVLARKMVELIHNCEKQYDDIKDECSRVVKVSACFKKDAIKEGIAPELAMIESVLEKY